MFYLKLRPVIVPAMVGSMSEDQQYVTGTIIQPQKYNIVLTRDDETIDFDEIVPVSFITHFYASTGIPHRHHLYPMLKILLIQRIFSIPTDTLLIIFLKYSQELRDFCGFSVVPDASKFTRFKQDFLMDLQSMFDNLVDITEPICQRIDSRLASMTIFD